MVGIILPVLLHALSNRAQAQRLDDLNRLHDRPWPDYRVLGRVRSRRRGYFAISGGIACVTFPVAAHSTPRANVTWKAGVARFGAT